MFSVLFNAAVSGNTRPECMSRSRDSLAGDGSSFLISRLRDRVESFEGLVIGRIMSGFELEKRIMRSIEKEGVDGGVDIVVRWAKGKGDVVVIRSR